MPNVLLAHPGTQHAPQLASELAARGLLACLATGIAIRDESAMASVLRRCMPWVWRRFATRRVVGLKRTQLAVHPWRELAALARMRRSIAYDEATYPRNVGFQHQVIRSLLDSVGDVVVGFDGSSWLLAAEAKNRGKVFVLDQTTIHAVEKEHIMEQVARRYPQWRVAVPRKAAHLIENERLEHETAAWIVAASTFARTTLERNGVPAERIRVIPYGSNFLPAESGAVRDPASGGRRIRFLFVGQISVHKGIPLLLESWAALRTTAAELWLVGHSSTEMLQHVSTVPGVRVVGRVPREQLSQIYSQADVLVLPSFFDGFGMVLLEAMAHGLPVIGSSATGAPDVLAGNTAGCVFESGDAEQLCAAMEQFLQSRSRLEESSRAALITARKFTWQRYGDRWASFLSEVAA